MFSNKLKGFFIVFLFCINCMDARKSQTCGDLDRETKAQTNEIANLKLQLEKYKLADDAIEDVLDECQRFATCTQCVREKNTQGCGWCFLRNQCSFKENCPGEDSKPQYWIPNGTEKCPKIRAVKPHLLPSASSRMLDVIITHMPEYKKPLICSFEIFGSSIFTRGKQTDKGVSCASPMIDINIPENSYYVPVILSIQVPNRPSFVSTTNLTIFDCHRYTSCTDCTSSLFPCAWCSVETRCTHDVDNNCKNDIVLFSKAVPKPSIRQGPSYCARILPNPAGTPNEILVPSGTKKRISVKVENILHSQASTRFFCKAKGHPQVTAQLLGDIIYCDAIKFQVLDRNPISNLSFDVYWGGNIRMDNPQNAHVIVYHCSLMASSCGQCIDLPDQYNCGWCDERDSCTVTDNCASDWLDKKRKCTKPDIISFYPKTGLFSRPTNITIKGINFGKEFKNIDGGVRLIDEDSEVISECKPIEDLYVKFSQIVCQLDIPDLSSENDKPLQGFFELKVHNEYVTISREEYLFVDPTITGFDPVKGMKSGGTFLTIRGNHLDAGNYVEVFIGDIPCIITSRDSSNIRCITSPSPRTRSSAVKVLFEKEGRMSSEYFFYVEDPYIRSVITEYNSDGPRGTPSGGNLIIVEGEYFDHVQNSYMYVIVDDVEYLGPCTLESPTVLKCLSPRVPAEILNFCSEEGFLAFDYGFRMDYLEDVQNLSKKVGFNKFHMYSDPFFTPFLEENRTNVYKSGHLIIEGRNIDSVLNENDISVEIGVEECMITALSLSQLTCRPPPTQPEARDGNSHKLPEVVVKVKGTQEYFIGFLRYDA